MPVRFIQASQSDEIDAARGLFREYEAWLGLDLCFQNFEKELAELPGAYGPPTGRLLLAYEGEQLAGCVASRKLSDGVCEMKRLFLRPEFQGKGRGRQLAQRIVDEARRAGYKQMRLDTLPEQMGKAIALYRSLGFREIEPYYDNPVAGAIFLELSLVSEARP